MNKYHSWYFQIVPNFTRLTAREITYNNFEISLVVFIPNITTNHAITYTNIMCKVRIENIPLHVEQGPKKKVTKLAIPESVNKARKWKFKILQASDFELMAVDYEYTQLIYR